MGKVIFTSGSETATNEMGLSVAVRLCSDIDMGRCAT